MKRVVFALAILASAPHAVDAQASPTPTADGTPLWVVGQVLALGTRYLVFTTGDSVALDPALVPARAPRMGEIVRVRIDRSSHAIVDLEFDPRGLGPGDIEAAKLPRDQIAVSPKSARTSGAEIGLGTVAHPVTVTIGVRVPDSTPPTDDVYLATDRTNFAPAEIRMTRIDARTFSTALQIASGTQLRYEFTRGNFATIERNKLGGIVTPRTLDAADKLETRDAVAQWADIN